MLPEAVGTVGRRCESLTFKEPYPSTNRIRVWRDVGQGDGLGRCPGRTVQTWPGTGGRGRWGEELAGTELRPTRGECWGKTGLPTLLPSDL